MTPAQNEHVELHSPIARIPIEVLTAIFSSLLDVAGNAPPRTNREPSCIAVTQVSAHWRRVAYRFKDLWTIIPLESKEWALVALEHSKPSLITVQWDNDSQPEYARPNLDALRLALAELPRVQFLWLEERPQPVGVRGPSFMNIAIRLLTQHPAPFLKTLGLEASPTLLRSDAPLFQGETPTLLQTLALDGCQFPSSTTLLSPALKALDLEYSTMWTTFPDMFEQLTRLPLLETITIGDGVLPLAADSDSALDVAVVLPKLVLFSINGDVLQITKVMRSLSFPPTADLSLSYQSALDLPEDEPFPGPEMHHESSSLIASTLSKHFSLAINNGTSFQTLSIAQDLSIPGFISINATAPETGDPQLPAELALQLFWPTPALTISIAWSLCIQLTPIFAGVRTMEVEHFMLLNDEMWPPLNMFASGVEELTVWREAAYGLLTAFDADAAGGDGRVLFPGLRRLCLRRLKLDERYGAEGRSYESVLAELKRRHQQASPCQLVITECNITNEMVEELRECLGEHALVWDGEYDGCIRADVMDPDSD